MSGTGLPRGTSANHFSTSARVFSTSISPAIERLAGDFLHHQADTLLLVEAKDHEEATTFIHKNLDPADLKPGTTNVRRVDTSRKWWVFGVFL